MKIGFCVEGAFDRAFVKGLVRRYCPTAELEEGHFRGSSGESLRKEIPKSLRELSVKSCDYVVFLTDANNQDWRDVYRSEWTRVPPEFHHITIYGVAERNIECWLNCDSITLARELGCNHLELNVSDPSGIVQSGFGFSHRLAGLADAEDRVARFVQNASFYDWIRRSDSFEHFWNQIWALSRRANCQMPNERENPHQE